MTSTVGTTTGKFHRVELFDLRQEYHHAIDRLIEWESMLCTVQEQLRLKDEKIISLEARIAQLSLEIKEMKGR